MLQIDSDDRRIRVTVMRRTDGLFRVEAERLIDATDAGGIKRGEFWGVIAHSTSLVDVESAARQLAVEKLASLVNQPPEPLSAEPAPAHDFDILPMHDKPRRRWWQFRLRTLLIAVVVLSIPLAWVAYSLNWIRERQDFSACITYSDATLPPAGLWSFGENGATLIVCPRDGWEQARRLFPEAEIPGADWKGQ